MKDNALLRWSGLGILLYLTIVVFLLGYTGRDDSHITYFVADAVAQGKGIVNYNQDPVEQSSSLFFMYLLSTVVKITGLKASFTGPYISFILYLTALFTLAAVCKKYFEHYLFLFAFLTPPIVYWSLSGMEGSLYFLLLFLLAMTFSGRKSTPWILGSIAFIACFSSLTRPEAPFVLALTTSLFVAFSYRTVLSRPYVLKGLALLLGIVSAFGFRLGIGLDLFPITVHAKQSLNVIERLTAGIFYLPNTFKTTPLSMIFCFICFVYMVKRQLFMSQTEDTERQETAKFLLAVVISVSLFSIASGGDWMEVGRFLTPVFAFSVLGAFLIYQKSNSRSLLMLLGLLSFFDFIWISSRDYGGSDWSNYFKPTHDFEVSYDVSGLEQLNTNHIRDIKFTDELISILNDDPREHIVIASIQAGMVPYYLYHNTEKDIELVDLMGLASQHVHQCDFNWFKDPYDRLDYYQSCIGIKFDYIFDLEIEDWGRLNMLVESGCQQLIKDEIKLYKFFKMTTKSSQQFLVKCD